MSNEVVVLESNLSVKFTDKAIADLKDQKIQLNKFVNSQLRKDVDYGIIPGVKSPSLYKPGAEKLANLFQLGSRIIKTERQVDIKENFAMIAHTVEVFHLPTGKVIAQCEGITNSQEKKWRDKAVYKNNQKVGTEPQAVGDLLNTLGKMALKRAYVGAIIMAVGASDFFTQDVEDMPEFQDRKPNPHAASANQPAHDDGDPTYDKGDTFKTGKFKGRSPQDVHEKELRSWVDWWDGKIAEGKQVTGMLRDDLNMAAEHLANMENGPANEEDVL